VHLIACLTMHAANNHRSDDLLLLCAVFRR
jgi:hypothetical protein